jgi:hypothetical protein
MERLMRKLLLLPLLFLASCTAPESKMLFEKIEAAFNGDAKQIEIESLTDFPWDDVCLFKATSAYPSVATSSYSDFTSRKNLQGEMPSYDYGLIFLFMKEGKIVREYYQSANSLTIKGNSTEINLASQKQFVKFCSESTGLMLTYDDTAAKPMLLISKRQ